MKSTEFGQCYGKYMQKEDTTGLDYNHGLKIESNSNKNDADQDFSNHFRNYDHFARDISDTALDYLSPRRMRQTLKAITKNDM